MGHVFHLTDRGVFSLALELGACVTDGLESEGFIHCSTKAQILRTAGRFFGGRSGLVLLCIDAAQLGSALRLEPADGELYPHCYGKIPLEAISAVIDFPCQPDGSFTLPDELTLFQD